MLTSSRKTGLPRRVVALYLLFCLAAMLLLIVGAIVAARALLSSQTTGGALARVGRVAAAIELGRLDANPSEPQRVLERAQAEGRLVYAAVVGPDGRFVAHTDTTLVGALAVEAIGDQLRWGDIDGVRFRDADDRLVSEYRAPLRANDRRIGSLLLAVAEPGWRGVLAELAGHAPWAIGAPLAAIVLGAWSLRRLTKPLAGIDGRLVAIARLPHGAEPRPEPVTPSSPAAIGWNRLVEHVQQLTARRGEEGGDPLKRLAAAAGAGRSNDALESLSEGVAVTDPEGRIDFANRAITALLGGESLDGAAFDELLERLAPEKAAQLQSASVDAEVVLEAAVPSDDGGRTLRLSRAPLGGDSSAGHVWTVRDVTQQKLAEASRDQFIDTATHELRTPLANIKAYAETLAMCDVTDVEQQKEFCNTINTEATRLARFVDDLLSISSIEVGTLGVNRQNVDVRRLVEEAAEKVAPLMKKKSLTFERCVSEKLGEARLDKDKVAGLLVNLLGNAAKYTPEGGAVSLTAVRQDDELKFEVTDTGVGISEEEQGKVFDKFFRSNNPDVQDEVGTGLGLSLAREIARLHRGDITLASVPGEGSTFTVLLPVQ